MDDGNGGFVSVPDVEDDLGDLEDAGSNTAAGLTSSEGVATVVVVVYVAVAGDESTEEGEDEEVSAREVSSSSSASRPGFLGSKLTVAPPRRLRLIMRASLLQSLLDAAGNSSC